ncbi:acyl-CoA thioester hydrolase/BAAT C-terminal domain-containing protein, partial [Bacillus licheniformis]|uniref:acyl-CoA thioester hydrolase/BAAT C-terminal domain-containing protein n=1 Tax=Bacillus licheniformis TaxID=1402 RepID=UPI0034A098A3
MIKAELIKGPILLTSSTDDLVWPSASMKEKIEERLKKNRFSYSVKHLYFEKAGHNIRPPDFPTSGRKSRKIAYGGRTEYDAIAAQTFWQELLLFL